MKSLISGSLERKLMEACKEVCLEQDISFQVIFLWPHQIKNEKWNSCLSHVTYKSKKYIFQRQYSDKNCKTFSF